MNKVLLIEDLCASGGCSALISLPIICNLNIEPLFIPSMLFSVHTGEKNKPIKYDLADNISGIINNIFANNKQIDAIFLGYLSPSINEDFINVLSNLNKKIFLDPVMGDNNKFYTGFDESYLEKMRKLVSISEVITPNLTEACLLAGESFDNITFDKLNQIINKLVSLGAKKVVITGIKEGDNQLIIGFDSNTGQLFRYGHNNLNGSYYGTGDAFKSVLFSLLVNNLKIEEATKKACDFVVDCIKNSCEFSKDLNYIPSLHKLNIK